MSIEPLIKSMAVELAGQFYERNRSERFRAAFPTWKHYKSGWRIVGENQAKKIPPGWVHFVVLARRLLVEMLKAPEARVSTYMKDQIAEALIRDRGASEKFGKRVHQKMEKDDYGEKSVAAVN